MKTLIYNLHILVGVAVSIPVLAWALSGLMYAWPDIVEGGTVATIDAARVTVSPANALQKANELVGKQLPTTALTLLMKDGRPQYQSIGGLGADSVFIDAETGTASLSAPPAWKTSFFRQAHFYYFAGEWQVTLLVIFSFLSAFSAATGIYLNVAYWSTRLTARRRRHALAKG
jgi:uncharacterized iron-regulated membrane protein